MKQPAWLKDCELCNAGVCKRIDELKDQGLSERAASRKMENDCDGLWSADKIHGRYRYYKKGHTGSVGKPHKLENQLLEQVSYINRESAAINKALEAAVTKSDFWNVAIRLGNLEASIEIGKAMLFRACSPATRQKIKKQFWSEEM